MTDEDLCGGNTRHVIVRSIEPRTAQVAVISALTSYSCTRVIYTYWHPPSVGYLLGISDNKLPYKEI